LHTETAGQVLVAHNVEDANEIFVDRSDDRKRKANDTATDEDKGKYKADDGQSSKLIINDFDDKRQKVHDDVLDDVESDDKQYSDEIAESRGIDNGCDGEAAGQGVGNQNEEERQSNALFVHQSDDKERTNYEKGQDEGKPTANDDQSSKLVTKHTDDKWLNSLGGVTSDGKHSDKLAECHVIDDDGDGEKISWKACEEHNGEAGHIRALQEGNHMILRMLETHDKYLYRRGFCLHGAQCGGPDCDRVLGLNMVLSRENVIHACANVTTSHHCNFILCNSCYYRCINVKDGQIGRKSVRRNKGKSGKYAN